MSSAPSRSRAALGRAVRRLGWGVLLAVLAASGAGLAELAAHPPGSPARAELTYAGDAALRGRLDAARAGLEQIAGDVQELSAEAKRALEDVASADPGRLQATLERGDAIAAAIERQSTALGETLADLPGDEPDAVMRYSNDLLVRRAATLIAVAASAELVGSWQSVAARAKETARLTQLIDDHDTTVLAAAEQGRNGEFKDAVATIDEALASIVAIAELRVRLVAPGQSVLDEWIERTRTYDLALQKLYAALVRSKGQVTVAVQSARREERAAFEQLPPDRRTILVIISEVTRNGLTQAVLAIEDASGRLDQALADVAEASAGPS